MNQDSAVDADHEEEMREWARREHLVDDPSAIESRREAEDDAKEQLRIESILGRLSKVAFDAGNPPPPEPVVFRVAGVEICHPGSITVIESHQKGGKSAFVSAGIASTFAEPGHDCLGWQSANPNGFAVLHFDTEQSRGDHYGLIMRALARAGLSVQPTWLRSYCLTGWSFLDMQAAVNVATAEAVNGCGGIHSIWLDGGADMVRSPNDEQEAFAFVRSLQDLAIVRACPVIGILHLNPGADGKSRGHLGSELNRKAETILRITKDDAQVSTVATQWTRRAPIPHDRQPRFAWSDEHGRHVSIPTDEQIKTNEQLIEARRIARGVWKGNEGGMFHFENLVEEVMRFLGQSKSTAKRKIGFMQQMNLVEKGVGGIGYVLSAEGSKCCEPDEAA